MTIQATYFGEVRVTRSSYTSKNGPTLTLALHDIDELNKVQGMDGKDNYTTEIVAESMQLLVGRDAKPEGRESEAAAPAPAPRRQQAPAPAPRTSTGFDDMDDDIPF